MAVTVQEETPKHIEVFCCYAPKDEPLLEALRSHLEPLKREAITLWDDREINAGGEWEKEISLHLHTSHIILLLVSPDFMASDYCYRTWITPAMKRHKEEGAQVIPIILRHTDLQNAPFAQLQVLPRNRLPISEWKHPDKVYVEVVKEIRKAVEALREGQFRSAPQMHVEKTKHDKFPRRTVIQCIGGMGLLAVCSDLAWSFFSQATPISDAKPTPEPTPVSDAKPDAKPTPEPTPEPDLGYKGYAKANGMMFGFNAQHTRENPYESVLNSTSVANITSRWVLSTGGSLLSSPVVAGGVVYVGCDDNNVYAVDAITGVVKWKFATKSWVYSSSPAIAGGVVYVGSKDGNMYALDATTGNKIWNFMTGSSTGLIGNVGNGGVDSSPVVSGGVVYFGSWDHSVYALDATTGNKIWVFTAEDAIVASSPAVSEGMVYVGCRDHNVYALDATNGVEKWKFPTGDYVDSSPAIVGGTVYFCSHDHNVYALDATTGVQKWAFPMGATSISSPAIAGGVVYIGSDDFNMYALDAATGKKIWNFMTGFNVTSSPVVAEGMLYFCSQDRNLYAFGLTS